MQISYAVPAKGAIVRSLPRRVGNAGPLALLLLLDPRRGLPASLAVRVRWTLRSMSFLLSLDSAGAPTGTDVQFFQAVLTRAQSLNTSPKCKWPGKARPFCQR